MLDGMSDSIQGSRIENLHSREVDRQSPTGLIFYFICILFLFVFYFICILFLIFFVHVILLYFDELYFISTSSSRVQLNFSVLETQEPVVG